MHLPREMRASQVARVVKSYPANAGDAGLIPGSGRSPGGGHSNSLQYSCLESSMVGGAQQATANGVAKSWTLTECVHAHIHKRTHT